MARDTSLLSSIERDDPLLSPLERRPGTARHVPARPAVLSPTGSAGASVLVPPAGGSVDLFSGFQVESLDATARAQPGWCFRFGFPNALPARVDEFIEWDMLDLLVELHATAGGVEQVIELDAYPGFAFPLAADQISARLKWGSSSPAVPPNVQAVWSVSRGLCESTATRSFDVGDGVESEGEVPPFATSFGLYTGMDPSAGGLALNFQISSDAIRQVHAFSNDELLGVIGGEHARVPPGSRVWRWVSTAVPVFRLTFAFGAVR
jgi:hypothetical protein